MTNPDQAPDNGRPAAPDLRVLPCGSNALLVELPNLQAVLGLYDSLRADPPDGVLDLVPASTTLLVKAVPTADLGNLTQALRAVRYLPRQQADAQAETVRIDVHYQGPDLAEVAALTGMTEREVVAAHTGTLWRVAFCGFAPGFGYLIGGDDRLRVPRRATSRVRVPAGSVALADQFTGVYPVATPGGWQLIGHTDAVLWDPDRQPPALLRPGVRVRFVEAT